MYIFGSTYYPTYSSKAYGYCIAPWYDYAAAVCVNAETGL